MAYLAERGLRRTAQRQAIIEAILGTTEHFTAEQLLQLARAKDPSISRATVYRTLPLLVEGGLLKELDLGGDSKVYDPNYTLRPKHSHIICEDCGRLVEFESELVERLEREVRERLGFRVKSFALQLTCSCEEFRRLGACAYDPSQVKGPEDCPVAKAYRRKRGLSE